jgi:hypothetical protein
MTPLDPCHWEHGAETNRGKASDSKMLAFGGARSGGDAWIPRIDAQMATVRVAYQMLCVMIGSWLCIGG